MWFVTDNKAGHRTQLLGLEQALAARCRLDSHWISIEQDWRDVWQQWRHATLPKPDWLVGAGRRTHLPVLLLKWRHRCRGLVLTKPTWPLAWFDLLALPRHDGVKPRDNLLLTEGSLNPILPAADPDLNAGLLLVGGPSSHFYWDGDALIEQIRQLIPRHPQMQWTLSTSRRTPADFLPRLAQLDSPNLNLLSVNDTPQGWVAQQLQRCGTVWVSEDSVSMVYEALSAGARVGLLAMPRRRRGRVAAGVDSLVERNYLTRFSDYLASGYRHQHQQPLQEADRVAECLLRRMREGSAK